LNELLFDTDEKGGTLRTPRNEGGVEKETIAVDTLFPNVLNGDSKKTRRESRTAAEPLL
jgi:hypothetical protein